MRQLSVHVPRDAADRIAEIGARHEAFSPIVTDARISNGRAWATVSLNVPNDRVGAFVAEVAREERDARFVLSPRGSLPIQPPLGGIDDRVKDVSRRSTLELVLDAMQSLGSWRGMMIYSTLSGLVAAYGVLIDATYLLVAAMLIAPMGAPALVCVVGSAVGDASMVRRGTLRFFAALLVLASVAAALGVAYGLEVSTATMEQISSLSVWSVMLAIVGGAAGAQALVRSDRDSLVTGTAAGFLVAVALSPPAAVLGLSTALQRWDYVALMSFVLVLTYVGILVGGWPSLVLLGVGPQETSAERGSRGVRWGSAALALVVLVGLVAWQSTLVPHFRKADLSHDAVSQVRTVVAGLPGLALVEASAHFTRPDADSTRTEGLLVDLVVVRTESGEASRAAASDETAVRAAVSSALRESLPGVRPFVRVTVLPADR